MTDKLRAAAEMALEELTQIKYGLERNRVWGGMEWSYVPIHPTQYLPLRDKLEAQIAALRQALDQLPDTTKMIEPSIGIVGWMYEDQLPEIYPYEAMFPFSVVDGVRMFPVYAPKSEPDMGIDRGAWSDVPDATKWVDELRGDDEELPPVKTYCGGKPNYCEPKEPPNSTTDVVEPVAWLWKNKDGHQVITDDPDYADGTWVPLYTAPPKPDLLNQTCCECGRSGGYALYCGDCWNKASQWQGLTDEDIIDLQKASWVDKQAFESVAWMIDEHLEKKQFLIY